MDIEKMQQKINEIYNFLFGSPLNPEKISFVSKVNLMFEELGFLKKTLIASITSILIFTFYMGQKINTLDDLVQDNYANSQKNDIIIDRLIEIQKKIK